MEDDLKQWVEYTEVALGEGYEVRAMQTGSDINNSKEFVFFITSPNLLPLGLVTARATTCKMAAEYAIQQVKERDPESDISSGEFDTIISVLQEFKRKAKALNEHNEAYVDRIIKKVRKKWTPPSETI